MSEFKATIGDKGRLVIPAPYRRALSLEAGDEVVMRLQDGELRIVSVKEALRRARQIVREHVPKDTNLAEGLIADRRAEAERE